MDLVRVGISASAPFEVNLLANLIGFIIRGIAKKSQWFHINSAHSFIRFNQGVLRFFQSTMLTRQLIILKYYCVIFHNTFSLAEIFLQGPSVERATLGLVLLLHSKGA